MAPKNLSKKRKLPTAPSPPAKNAPAALPVEVDSDSEDEIGAGLLNGDLDSEDDSADEAYTGSEDEGSEEDDEADEDEEDEETSDDESADEFPELEADEDSAVESDEVPSEGEYEDGGKVDAAGRKIIIDSAGNPRYIYPEVVPNYDSDDSDREMKNTIGNIDLNLYDEYPHVGYDINGKKIMRPAKGKALDALLDQIDIPKGWTGLLDKETGADLKLTKEELEILRKIQMDEAPDGYDPYAPTIEYFTSKTEVMPLSAAPEPKRRFIPSKHEQKRVMKIVRAIREGRIVPNKPKEPETPKYYDIWADNAPPRPDHVMHIPAPKLPPPTHDESYNPPEEYLPTPEEKAKWESEEPEHREKDYLPRKHTALRLVPGYDKFMNERFERCLDLYLAPRVRRNKLNIDPESLLPKLPSPQDLRPFPTTTATVYRGHEGRVRTLSVDPTGIWLATGGDDGTIRIWEILTGREVWKLKLSEEAVTAVKWRPVKETGILAASTGDDLFLIAPPIFDPRTIELSLQTLESGFAHQTVTSTSIAATTKEPPAKWSRPLIAGAHLQIAVKHTIKHLTWHRRGDYLCSVAPEAQNRSVCIHHLPRHSSQHPFRKSRGIVQKVEFHPSKPMLFVATQRYVRIYDLGKSELSKTLTPGARWISSFDIHPGGDNVIVGSYDKRLLWHDMELSTKPYRTLRYTEKAIRQVAYHKGGLPLFCSASDDGTIQVFHGRVYADLMENPLIVPLKVLRGHRVTKALGVLDVEWHPKECWVFSAGADGTARLWN